MSSFHPDSQSPTLTWLLADQTDRWRRGDRVTAERYLECYPELATTNESLLELIRSEMTLRMESGESAPLDEYFHRFPNLAEALRKAGQPHSGGPTLIWPQGGDNTNTFTMSARGGALPGFELIEILGEGGMGVVYRARDVRLNQPRAIKVIRGGPLAGRLAHERFSREGQAVARLNHPGVIRIYSLGEHSDTLFICMELVNTGSLKDRLAKGPLPIVEAMELVRQLALAVQHAHDNRVLHRDLKPGNVLLAADGSPKVSDFGLAKLLDNTDDLTMSGAVMGTPMYMAPEQADGRASEVCERTDIWAIGTILYECLVGKPPFHAETRTETFELVRTQTPTSIRQFRPDVSEDLEAVCLKCLEKRPENRYFTAADLAGDLQACLDGRRPVARVTHRGWRRWRFAAALVIVGILCAGALALRPHADPIVPVAALKPGVWHDVLAKEPEVLRWPGGKNDKVHYDSKEHSLEVSCGTDLGLVALGEATTSSYHFAITVQQNSWIGKIGLFFGYHELNNNGQPEQRYQTIDLVPVERDSNAAFWFRVDWKNVTFRGPLGSRQPQIVGMRAASQPLFTLDRGEHRFFISVGPGGLKEVTLDNKPFPGLSAEADKNLPQLESKGKFGVYVDNSHGVFRDAQFIFYEESQ